MSELRAEAINLIQSTPEKYLAGLYENIQDFIFEKMEVEAEENYDLWNSDPDKYENEINEYCCQFVKKVRRESERKKNANLN